VVGGYQGRPVDGAEVRSHVDKRDVRLELVRSAGDQAAKRGDDAEGTLVAIEAG